MPIVSIAALRAPRAAPNRCSASSGEVGVVVDRDRQPQPLGDQVADRHVGEVEVDGHDRRLRARGRSCTGCRARSPPRPGAPRAPPRSSRSSVSRSSSWSGRCSAPSTLWRTWRRSPRPRPASSCRPGRRPSPHGRSSGPSAPMIFRVGHAAVLPADAERRPEQGRRPERPDYKVYKSRPGLLSRLRAPDLSKLRERTKRQGRRRRGGRDRKPESRRAGRAAAVAPASCKWVGIAALAWILISFAGLRDLLADPEGEAGRHGQHAARQPVPGGQPADDPRDRHRHPLGPVRRPRRGGARRTASRPPGSGEAPPTNCTPYRSDTLMLLRAGGGAFRKLSIPRDTLAEIPGQPENKINSAYATGGAKLTVRTIENFLGINVDQVAIIDFDGFRKFIDSIGGVEVNVPTDVCSSVSGGAFNLKLERGSTRSTATRRSPSPAPARTTCPPTTGSAKPAADHRHQPGPVPAGGPGRDQGPAHRPAPAPVQLHQGAVHRLERAEGDGLQHGRLDDAPAGVRRGDRLQQGLGRAEAQRRRPPPATCHPPARVRASGEEVPRRSSPPHSPACSPPS